MKIDDVQDWIAKAEAKLDLTGIETFSMRVSAHDVQMSGWQRWRFETVSGANVEECYSALREKFPHASELATRKREEARRLLREANELEATL